MANRWHIEWLREGVSKWNKRRTKVNFVPNLSGLNFFEILPPDWRDTPKASRYFERINLSQCDLTNSDLSTLNFSKANFNGANLSGANMTMSNFTAAKFLKANLSGADASNSFMESAIFEDANLESVNFHLADATDAIFTNTIRSPNQIRDLDEVISKNMASRTEFQSEESNMIAFDIEPSIKRRIAGELKRPAEKTKKIWYDVFYGTNRKPVSERNQLVGFDGNRDKKLNYGVCEVIVPDGHRVGSIGTPLWKRRWNQASDELKINNIIVLNQALFYNHLVTTLKGMKVQTKPTIFVHGYNHSFEDAVLRAAQIGFDIGIGQGIGLFSWPSKGKLLGYLADEASAEASKHLLADFIEGFVENSPKKGVNLIAHSMGCRCLLGAFDVLAKDKVHILEKIDQTILAAADVDTDAMPYLGKHAVDHSARTTSYISDKDSALQISGWLHKYPRVGVTPPTYVLKGMDTVLVNDLDLGGLLSHSYVSSSRTVLNDIFDLLKDNTSPNERFSIEPVSENGNKFWKFKK